MLPISTTPRLSTHTPSPIQEWSPTANRQGNLIRTLGLMVTPRPMRAPKHLRSTRRCSEPGSHDATSVSRTSHQSASTQADLPRENPTDRYSSSFNSANLQNVLGLQVLGVNGHIRTLRLLGDRWFLLLDRIGWSGFFNVNGARPPEAWRSWRTATDARPMTGNLRRVPARPARVRAGAKNDRFRQFSASHAFGAMGCGNSIPQLAFPKKHQCSSRFDFFASRIELSTGSGIGIGGSVASF